ncbi:hypothetical protein DSO57_1038557 [Entomophthora muscae]|uniref:Uncharacterized protein n=2 Tax=Entomophthora muscae TaxID=34485 RepID=A0ACC2SBD9_9FUNG|nr:hypothetical protein DSO57_1019694 [Entomophthora muscae]KAJ9059722.1 hypothetical protein DSO57_1038557 [Entomophthora muscae]
MSDLDYDGHSDQFDDQDNQYRGGYVDDILDDDTELNEQGTPTTTEALNLDECEDKVWLLKVPTFLADKWEEAMKEGADLGKLKFYNQEVYPEGTSSHTRMVLTLPESFEGIPRDYTLNVVNEKVENTYIFEEYNNKVAKKISGTVIRDLIANPFPTDPEYRSILRKRALDAGEKNRSVSLESQGRQLEYLKPSRGNGPGWGGLGKRSKLDVDSKAARLSEKDLMDMLFKLFAEYRFWSLKGLQKRTEQPVVRHILVSHSFVGSP